MNEFLIVGLGNPGAKYQFTRHNVGFMVVDLIATQYKTPAFRTNFKSFFTFFNINHAKVLLLKPQKYMNMSGQAVLDCASFYKITRDRIIVIHDDLDLEVGRIKVKVGGSNGGHNGLKSIDEMMGNDYMRVRVGISRPKDKAQVIDYVLSDFKDSELKLLNVVMTEVAKRLQLLFSGDISRFMNYCSLAIIDGNC